jgi:hypothetical protein
MKKYHWKGKKKVQFKLDVINRGKNNYEKKKRVHQRHVKQATRRRREKWKASISRVMAT